MFVKATAKLTALLSQEVRALSFKTRTILKSVKNANAIASAQTPRKNCSNTIDKSILNIISQIDISYSRIKTIQNRVDLEEENLDRAEKYYKSVLSEFIRGLKNSVDLKQATEVHFDAHLRKEQYKFEFLFKRIELEKSLGATVEIETESDLQHDYSKP